MARALRLFANILPVPHSNTYFFIYFFYFFAGAGVKSNFSQEKTGELLAPNHPRLKLTGYVSPIIFQTELQSNLSTGWRPTWSAGRSGFCSRLTSGQLPKTLRSRAVKLSIRWLTQPELRYFLFSVCGLSWSRLMGSHHAECGSALGFLHLLVFAALHWLDFLSFNTKISKVWIIAQTIKQTLINQCECILRLRGFFF